MDRLKSRRVLRTLGIISLLTGIATKPLGVIAGPPNDTFVFVLDGKSYPTDDGGLHAAARDCVAHKGGEILIPSGVTVTQTSTLVLGDKTGKPQCVLKINPGGSLLVDITTGDDAILLGDGAGVWAETTVVPYAGSFPASVRMNPHTRIHALFAPLSRAGDEEGFTIRNISVHGSCSATLESAVFDLQGVFSGTRIEGVYTETVPGKVVRIRPGTGEKTKIASDIIIDGNLDATHCARGQAISIEAAAQSEVANITFSGQAQHAGDGLPVIAIDGAGVGYGVHNIHFRGAYHVETSGTPGENAIVISDASHVSFDSLELSGPVGTNVVSISQTRLNATHDIELKHVRTSGAWKNVVNNTISGYSTGSDIAGYFFGGGGAGPGGHGRYVFDSMPIHIGAEAISAAPRMTFSGFYSGALTSRAQIAILAPGKAIAVTRITAALRTAGAMCRTQPVVQVSDGATPLTLTIQNNNNQNLSAAFSQNYAANSTLALVLAVPAEGCSTNPADMNVTVEYRMQ